MSASEENQMATSSLSIAFSKEKHTSPPSLLLLRKSSHWWKDITQTMTVHLCEDIMLSQTVEADALKGKVNPSVKSHGLVAC